jgi:hypothetical protein
MEAKNDVYTISNQVISELADWLDTALIESVLDPESACLERIIPKLEPQTRTLPLSRSPYIKLASGSPLPLP